MKKKVRAALEAVRKDLDRSERKSYSHATVTLKDLQTLVKWAEKKAKKPETLAVGDAVRLVRDLPHGGSMLRKGTTGKVRSLLGDDTVYDVEVYMDVVDRYSILAFTFKELEKVPDA